MELGGKEQRTIPLLVADTSKIASVPQRDFQLARDAYLQGDIEASKRAHSYKPLTHGLHYHSEKHTNASSDYVKALVFGGLDGIVTIFAIVAGCVGAHLTPMQTLIVGCGNLLADAFSMGFGEYVGASTEADYIRSEKARELWEVENFPEGEKQEMMEIYENKYGFSHEDAQTMVDISFKYRDFCISHMMAEELGLLVDEDGPTPIKRGLKTTTSIPTLHSVFSGGVMFSAFSTFGLVPLAGFSLVAWLTEGLGTAVERTEQQMHAFWAASMASCVTLFILGSIKATFINQPRVKSGLQMTANGVFAGFVAYIVGALLQKLVGTTPVG